MATLINVRSSAEAAETKRWLVVARIVNDCEMISTPASLSRTEWQWLSTLVARLKISPIPANQSPVVAYGFHFLTAAELNRLGKEDSSLTIKAQPVEPMSLDRLAKLASESGFGHWAGNKVVSDIPSMIQAAKRFDNQQSSENFDLYSEARRETFEVLRQQFQLNSQQTTGCDPD